MIASSYPPVIPVILLALVYYGFKLSGNDFFEWYKQFERKHPNITMSIIFGLMAVIGIGGAILYP